MASTEHQAFEVQVHQNGRWQLHARHAYHERGTAIKEAKQLSDENSRLAIRVIMEEYNPDTGHHNEVLVFRNRVETTKAFAPKKGRINWADMAVSSDGRVGFLPEDQNDFAHSFDYDEPKRKKKKVSTITFLLISLIIMGVAFGVGGLSAGALFLLVKGFGATLAPSMLKAMMLGMFMLVGLIAGISTLNYYRLNYDLNPFNQKKRPNLKVQKSNISKQMEKAAEAIDKAPSVEQVKEQEVASVNIFERDSNEEEDMPKSISQDISETDEKPAFSATAQHQKMLLVNYLGVIMSALKGPEASIKSLNRFALNLFMTGSVMQLCEDHGLTDDEEHEILCRLLEMLGASPDQAERFAMEYEKYLVDERHNNLFTKAGELVHLYRDNDPAVSIGIVEAIEEWVNFKTIHNLKNPNQRCVFFTDMVGSTDLTTKHGDYAAQEVLKAHDLIVRTALTNFEGNEIKHLGDGIMASFKDTDKALETAKEILKRVEGNNKSGPEFPLHIRIGINVGEPIRKGNDLFGNVVQLAARLCSIAETDSIAVSKFLVDDCGEQTPHTFVHIGQKLLKGFDVPMDIYHLDWTAPPRIFEETSGEEAEASPHSDENAEVTSEVPPPIGEETAEIPPAPMAVEGVAPDTATTKAKPIPKGDFSEGLEFKTEDQPKNV